MLARVGPTARSKLPIRSQPPVKKLKTTAVVVAVAALGFGVACETARAQAATGVELNGSGFLSLVGGRVLNGSHDESTDLGYGCPCFISDYAQNGVYESGGWRFKPDSKIGLQGTASVDSGRYSLTAQAVSRGARSGKVDLEWLYATAELDSNWTLQVGRKRLPLFLSSEVQDVGFALPWVHLPPQLYGWEVVNYDGASITWRGNVGPWLGTVNAFGGGETVHDSGFSKIYNGKDSRTDSRWSGIAGVEAKLSRDWYDVRGAYITSTTQNRIVSAGETDYSPKARQHIYGLSFNADDGRWVGRVEALYINREADYGFDHAQLYAGGYRFGAWLPMLSYAHYQQSLVDPAGAPEAHSTRSLVLRYDWDRTSAVKVQYDLWRDKSGAGFGSQHGDAHLLSFSYDRVF